MDHADNRREENREHEALHRLGAKEVLEHWVLVHLIAVDRLCERKGSPPAAQDKGRDPKEASRSRDPWRACRQDSR